MRNAESHPHLTPSALLGEWTLDEVQNHKMQRALSTFLDGRNADDVRLKAARAVLRDGSRHGTILLCEAMHRALPDFFSPSLCLQTISSLAAHPLSAIHGVLRIKALRLLKEPSSHHGRDHLSALRWLAHVCTPEDLELFMELLLHYREAGERAVQATLHALIIHASRVLWIMHARTLRLSSLWRTFIHLLLCDQAPPSSLMPLLQTIDASTAPDWYEDALLHGVQIHDAHLERQGEFIFALLQHHPERYEALARDFIFQRDRQPQGSRYTDAIQGIHQHFFGAQQLERQLTRACTMILSSTSIEERHLLASQLTQHRITHIRVARLIVHATLPHTLTLGAEPRRVLLQALTHLPLDMEHLPLSWHLAQHLELLEHRLLALQLMSRSLHAHHGDESSHATVRQWFARLTAYLVSLLTQMRTLWQTGSHDEVTHHHERDLLRGVVSSLCTPPLASELYTSLWTWLLDEALATPRSPPPLLAELLEVMLEEKLMHHFERLASPALQATLQEAHDNMRHHERTMLALRQALRHLKTLL